MPFQETCVESEKARFCVEFEQGLTSMAELCRTYGISRKTGYQVIERWQAGGAAALLPLSHAPKNCPHKLDRSREAEVVAVRVAHPSWGPKKVKAWLTNRQPDVAWPAVSTIGDILGRHGLVAKRRSRRRAHPASTPFAACAEANDLWSMDFKGWGITGDGTRIDPLTVQDQATRYLLRLVAVERTNTEHVQAVLAAAFHEHGLPKAMRSDNGPPFGCTGLGGLSRLGVWLIKCGVLPDLIDPASPQQNGRLERMHRDLKAETMSPCAATPRQQAERYRSFQTTFNDERPHEALDLKPPASAYAPSPRLWTGRAVAPEYGDGMEVRRVRTNGEIKWHGGLVYLNCALAGEPVGLNQTADDTWQISFGPVALGTLSRDGRVRRLRPPGGKRRRPGRAFAPCRNPLVHDASIPESVTHHAG